MNGTYNILNELPLELLREFSRNSKVNFKKTEDIVGFANNCGTVELVDPLKDPEVKYKSYLLIEGEIKREELYSLSEFANSEMEGQFRVVKSVFPEINNFHLSQLYEYHQLDAGLLRDDITSKRYFVTRIILPEYLHSYIVFGEELDDYEEILEKLISKLNIFTETNTSVYTNLIARHIKDRTHGYKNLMNKKFIPELPEVIKTGYLT